MTGPDADDRVFFLNLYIIRYGTKDHTQGGAMFLAILFLLIAVAIIYLGFGATKENLSWFEKVISLVWGALMFVVGVIIGRGKTTDGE